MAESYLTSIPVPGGKMLASLIAARWLGHGRAVECFLACTAGLLGVGILAFPGASCVSVATSGLPADGYGRLLLVQPLLKAALTGGGLFLNIQGGPYSNQIRFFGALIGSFIWVWLIFQFAPLDVFLFLGPFLVMAALFSVRIMGMALAGVPLPGAPGRQ